MSRRLNIKLPASGIFSKLLSYFLVLSILPLIVLGYMATKNMSESGHESISITKQMGENNLKSAGQIGRQAIEDSVESLDNKSTEAIELRTMELAQRIADFLYERDNDILMLSAFKPDQDKYLKVYASCSRDVIVPGPWPRETGTEKIDRLLWENPENKTSWRHRPPDNFKKVSKPIYKEITFLDLKGREKIKIKDEKISNDLKDVSRKENTHCGAEEYFLHISGLKQGEIYVSRVIGEYVKGWLFKTEEGIKVKPESGHAGRENPGGKTFEGIIRWVTPVYDGKTRLGYLTMALDHSHIMEMTDYVVPTEERFSDLSDGGTGNYAFLWDDQDQCISHARDFFICGYDPETGKEVPSWISQETYDIYKKSGISLEEFVSKLPHFSKFSQKKPGAKEQIKDGCISLDCRILDTAPQCQGWHRGTEDGGSGSFLILWSGLWKLTTYAAVPYYTGIYGNSERGFGYVTIGANVNDFHKVANITKASIEQSILDQGKDIEAATAKARKVMQKSAAKNRNLIILITILAAVAVICASIIFSLTITRPLKRLTEGAMAMSRGQLDQHIDIKSRDEIGELSKSFNEMAAAVAEVDRIKSEFVTIVSHELRTPIHAMLLGVSGILEGYSGEISDEAKEDLLIVNDGISRLQGLVENLLDLSRIEARKFQLNIAAARLEALVDSALEEVSPLIQSRQHDIIKYIPEDMPEIYVDDERILQVIINILSNAIKYTPEGGKIIIRAEKKDNELVLSVADNGYGIPLWAHEKIFDKFFQADSIMSQEVGGSGLGLTITKGIVEEHGGAISFESPAPEERFPDLPLGGERKGCVFSIHMPLG